MGRHFEMRAKMFAFDEKLRPYFTALYALEFDVGSGPRIPELLAPEWAAIMLTHEGEPSNAAMVPAKRQPCARFCVGGPATRAIDIDVATSRMYGLGLTPAGWARYVDANAKDFTDRIVDGDEHSEFAPFSALYDIVCDVGHDEQETASAINAHLLSLPSGGKGHEGQVLKIQEALTSSLSADVQSLCEATGMNRRQLERLSSRYFGFPPKTLLRRQRFLRSLARYLLTAPENWSSVVDDLYVDQSHFVRDFRSFMGMTPSQYARMEHPILAKIARQRLADVGAAPATILHQIEPM